MFWTYLMLLYIHTNCCKNNWAENKSTAPLFDWLFCPRFFIYLQLWFSTNIIRAVLHRAIELLRQIYREMSELGTQGNPLIVLSSYLFWLHPLQCSNALIRHLSNALISYTGHSLSELCLFICTIHIYVCMYTVCWVSIFCLP